MKKEHEHNYTATLGKWYSWDAPTGLAIGLLGLSLGLGVILSSVGLLALLLHKAGLL